MRSHCGCLMRARPSVDPGDVPSQASDPAYYRLPASLPLASALRGKTLVEYPVLHVLLPRELDGHKLIEPEEAAAQAAAAAAAQRGLPPPRPPSGPPPPPDPAAEGAGALLGGSPLSEPLSGSTPPSDPASTPGQTARAPHGVNGSGTEHGRQASSLPQQPGMAGEAALVKCSEEADPK